jgi:hypothetical protein
VQLVPDYAAGTILRHLDEPIAGVRLGEHAGHHLFALGGRQASPGDRLDIVAAPTLDQSTWYYICHVTPDEARVFAIALGGDVAAALDRHLRERDQARRVFRAMQDELRGYVQSGHLTGDERSLDDVVPVAPSGILGQDYLYDHYGALDGPAQIRLHDRALLLLDSWLASGGLRRLHDSNLRDRD